MEWKSRMIWNCPAVDAELRLGYHCPELWWSLPRTTDPTARHCPACRRDVHLCQTVDEFVALAART